MDEAREVWDQHCTGSDHPFSQLPFQARQLARLPLYMHLLRTAGNGNAMSESTAYRLIDFCVRSIVNQAGDVEPTMVRLTALAEFELAHLLPSQLDSPAPLTGDAMVSWLASGQILSPLLRSVTAGLPTFDHDVIREYFLATRIAQLIEDHGRSAASIAALNELAVQAGWSATAHGVLEFLIQCLDSTAPDLVAAISLSPTIGIAASLPLMLDMAGEEAVFATDEVLRSCASRSLHDTGLNLAKALLRRHRLASALADYHSRWLIEVLRQFGSSAWPDMVAHAEKHLSASSLRRLLDTADLTTAADGVFFARHATVFFGDDPHFAGQLKTLLGHGDWRVRAALADGMWRSPTLHPSVDAILNSLVRDRDYKVRAAAAEAVGHLGTAVAASYRAALALDSNWHVRERLIGGLIGGDVITDERVCSILDSDVTWYHCPAHIRVSMERLLLIAGVLRGEFTDSYHRALFGILRETRTGSLRLSPEVLAGLIGHAKKSTHWLTSKEAANFHSAGTWSEDIRASREAFRRLRERHAVQIALDTRDLNQAIAVAEAAAQAGAEFVEVGDPLIKSVGVVAIGHIKQRFPGLVVVAEMMSTDWGRDQVVLAAEAGADVVLLIGPASTASVVAAVDAGRKLGVPLMLDVPHHLIDRT